MHKFPENKTGYILSFNKTNWRETCTENKTNNMRIDQYYLGKEVYVFTNEELEFVYTEMLRDVIKDKKLLQLLDKKYTKTGFSIPELEDFTLNSMLSVKIIDNNKIGLFDDDKLIISDDFDLSKASSSFMMSDSIGFDYHPINIIDTLVTCATAYAIR